MLKIGLLGTLTATAVLTCSGAIITPSAEASGVSSSVQTINSKSVQYPASTVYAVRGVRNDDQVLSAANANHYETRHFQILWGNGDLNQQITPELLAQAGRMLEQSLTFYMDKLHMQPPFTSVSSSANTHPYKINVVIMETGLPLYEKGWAFAGMDTDGYPYLMMAPDALKNDTVVPHELGHAVQFAQSNNSWRDNPYLGPWYETIANWFREEYITSAGYRQSGGTGVPELTPPYVRALSLTAVNGRAYYEAWPFVKYLEENPDQLPGYGEGFMAKLLRSGNPQNQQESFYELIARVNPQTNLKDTIGRYAAHMATFDFREKKSYNEQIYRLLQNGELYEQQLYTMLNAVQGQANLYEVPPERAPQAAGYNIIPLQVRIPAGQNSVIVTARLNGLTQAADANWQAYLIVEDNHGISRYSKPFGSGEIVQQSITTGEKAYISVAATPSLSIMSQSKMGIGSWDQTFSEKNKPFESKPRYPYTLQLEHAEPNLSPIGIDSGVSGHRHGNGGGFVADSAFVDASVYVAPNAKVLDNAVVKQNARIEDNAIVRGDAQIGGNARLTGHAMAQGNAVIDGSAWLSDYAIVDGYAAVTDQAHVSDQAIVRDDAAISGSSSVMESALVGGYYTVSDHAVIKGMSIVQGGESKEKHGGASGNAITYGDFYDDMGYNLVDGSFSGYLSIDASVNTFKDGYAIKSGSGYARSPIK